MSWAEVKKINSDLSMPLNELLLDESQKCVYGLKTSRAYINSGNDITSSFKTLVNVSGKGCLANLLFYGFLEGTGYNVGASCLVKVTVDDKIILNLKINPVYSGDTSKLNAIMGILNLKSGSFSSDVFEPLCDLNNMKGDVDYKTKLNKILTSSNSKATQRGYIDFSSNLKTISTGTIKTTTTGNLLEVVLMNKLLHFNKGFKLEVASGADKNITNYEHLVTYTLDD